MSLKSLTYIAKRYQWTISEAVKKPAKRTKVTLNFDIEGAGSN